MGGPADAQPVLRTCHCALPSVEIHSTWSGWAAPSPTRRRAPVAAGRHRAGAFAAGMTGPAVPYNPGHGRPRTVRPLSGLQVLELGNFIAGPFAGQLLGDYGAEVIKIETPGEGDPMRAWGLTRDGQGLWWPAIARNKRSVAVDLRDEAGRDSCGAWLDRVDVVLENFRPGRLDEWGLGYEQMRPLQPRPHRRPRVGLRPDRPPVRRRRLRVHR